MTPPPVPTIASPADVALLVRLLEERGVGLRVSPSGELMIRDRDRRLAPEDRQFVHEHRHEIAGWLSSPEVTDAKDPVEETITPQSDLVEKAQAPPPDGPRCDRCGGPEFVEVPIHEGASLRRDCGRCRRTWGFPVWYGVAE